MPPARRSSTTGFNLYVVLLDPAVLHHKRFRDANPRHDPAKPSVYVGRTGLSPEDRFAKHKQGIKANGYVRRYGIRLLPELYRRFRNMPRAEADRMEGRLATMLRRHGYAVWQK
jgi:predicted GIY-YIG superfamily endonuclease